ncbi:MAG: hypothetical protein ACK5O2_09660 [Microthrixaceae bacterium]
MRSRKRLSRLGAVAAGALLVALLAACAPEPPPPSVHHLTTWQGDVTYPDTNPDIVDWVGVGSFAYNTGGINGCSILDGGAGWTESFVRTDANTVRVTITLDWLEGYPLECGVQDIQGDLKDASGNSVRFAIIPLLSHTP